MKRSLFNCLIVSIVVLLSSCSTTQMVKSNMDLKRFPMTYEMDSIPPVTRKKNVTVAVAPVKFDPSMMNNTTVMKRDKLLVLPLVVINVWEFHDTCILGKKSFKDDIPTFVQTALINEINFSGLVNAKADPQSEYSLDVSIDNLKTEGEYSRSGLSFIFFFSRAEISSPPVSTMKVTYALKKGNQVVKQNTFSSSKTEVIAKKKHYTDNALMQMEFAGSMVNLTAQNFKLINELIVNDLNEYFRKLN